MQKFLFFVLLFIISPAFLSGDIVRKNDLSMEELVKQSEIILHVKKRKKYTSRRSIPIDPKNPSKYPPFIKEFKNYDVIDVIYSKETEIEKSISVGFYMNFRLNIQRKYYLEDRGTSYTYPLYKSPEESKRIERQNEFIIFIQRRKGRDSVDEKYRFEAVNAVEDIKYKNKILEILKNNKSVNIE
ncbi:MAG: hypothetical protein OEZ34_09760 [Spirochaetia bacterium]|nr:hypothetical protein [Spirochaetia bacterium]